MTDRDSAEQIEACAARWVVRLDREPLDADAQAELDAWLAGDTRRRGAFMRARAAWSLLDRGQVAVGEPYRRGSRKHPSDASKPSRRNLVAAGLVSAAAALVAAPLLVHHLTSTRYRTTDGEIRRVPLRDGSMAALNTDTVLAIDLRPNMRVVHLQDGEAWFQVAKDPQRPFVVETGAIRVQAIGTAFSVRKRKGGAEVLVTEGVVEVWSEGQNTRLSLKAGERTFVNDISGAEAPKHAALKISRDLAWRDGQIILDGETVAQAVEEFNRYNDRKLVVADAALASAGLVGWFHTNDPEGFADAVAVTLGGRVENRDTEIVITPTTKKAES